MTNRHWRKGIQGLGLVTAMLVLMSLLQEYRHAAPPAMGAAPDQQSLRASIAAASGLEVPDRARVVAFSGEDERDGRYYYWVLFTKDEPALPGSLDAFKDMFEPNVKQVVRSIERSMIPYKIKAAKEVKNYAWSHHDFKIIALSVRAEKGWYIWLDAAKQGLPVAAQ